MAYGSAEYKTFEIDKNDTLGRYLVAARDIDAGDIIIHENALVEGPSQITGPVCMECLQSINEQISLPCKQCGWPLCKTGKCRQISNHKPECDWTVQKRGSKINIRSFITPHRSYECITAIRCLYQKQNNPNVWRKLQKLESHCNERKTTEKYESDRIAVAQFLHRFFNVTPEEFGEEEILKICGIIQINGHEIPFTDPPHVAIFEMTSMLEHSCVPNCCKTFLQDGSIMIRATRNIQKGEHLSICYTDPLWSTVNRQEHLVLTKFFYCVCARCNDPTELGTYYSALHCFDKSCPGYLLPNLPKHHKSSPQPEWKCDSCQKIEIKNNVVRVLSRVGQDYSMTDKQDTSSCEIFLKHYSNNRLLHQNHYFLNDVRLKLAQLYGQTEENDVADLSDLDLERKLNLCRQTLDFATVLYPAEWRIQGALKFELHAALAEHARREMINRRTDSDGLRTKLLESKKWLEETIFHLKYEPETLPEGKIVKQGEKNLIDLDSLLVKMYFQI